MKRDEVVRAEEGADAELGPQAADRADRQRPVAAELGEGREVARVVELGGGRVAVEAVALEQDLLAALVDADGPARGLDVARLEPGRGIAAEDRVSADQRQPSHPLILFAALERLEAAQEVARRGCSSHPPP